MLEPIDDPAEYNRVVAAMPHTSPLQAWGYGHARETVKQKPMRFLITKDGATAGAVQLLRAPLGLGATMLYAPRGPALSDLSLLPDLVEPLRRLRSLTDLYLRIEPPHPIPGTLPTIADLEDVRTDQADIPERYGRFTRSRTEQPEHTLIADLRPDEDDLFAGLHRMARRNIRTAERAGVEVGRDEDFDAFWQIFTATNERSTLSAFSREYYEELHQTGNQYGSEAYLVLARHEGRALAGGFFLAHGDTTAYLYGGSIRDDRPPSDGGDKRKDAKAPDAFYWHAMLDAKRRGYTNFDFWGIPKVLDESKHSYGVFKMKLKFSTARYWFPAYDVPLSPLAAPAEKVAAKLRALRNKRARGTAEDIL